MSITKLQAIENNGQRVLTTEQLAESYETTERRILENFNRNEHMLSDIDKAKEALKNRTAWRIEGTLREFPKFPPVNLWFDYPIHRLDDVGVLNDIDVEGVKPPWERATEKRKESAISKRKDKNIEFENAINTFHSEEPPTVKELAETLGITERSVYDRIKMHGGYWEDKNDKRVKRKDNN